MGEQAPWTIRQIGHVWYVRFRHAGRRHEYSTGQRERATAEMHAAIIYGKVLSGEWVRTSTVGVEPPETDSPTFADVADSWTSGQLAEDFPDHVGTKKTADLDESRLEHLCKTIGGVPISTFT